MVWVVEEPPPPHATHVSMASITTGTNRTGARLRFRSATQLKETRIAVDVKIHAKSSNIGGSPMGNTVAVVKGAVVPTFTVTDWGVVPLICTDELDKLHVGAGVTTGVTAQLRFTVPLNVPDPARLRLKLAVCPALTVCDVAEGGFMLKSGAAWITRDTAELFTIEPALPFTCTGYVPAVVAVVVVIVSVDVPDAFDRVEGLNAQVVPVGKPAHESATELLNPNVGVSFTVAVVWFPAVTVAGDNAPVKTSKPGAVLLSITPNPPTEGKSMSGRPSPFISAIKTDEKKPLVGTAISGRKVPSPFPRRIPVCGEQLEQGGVL